MTLELAIVCTYNHTNQIQKLPWFNRNKNQILYYYNFIIMLRFRYFNLNGSCLKSRRLKYYTFQDLKKKIFKKKL